MANEVRRNRFQLTHAVISYPRPIGKSWLDRFRIRHFEIKGVRTRKIEAARHKALSRKVVTLWFKAVTELRIEQ